jgi:cytochrome c oxidase subunit 4
MLKFIPQKQALQSFVRRNATAASVGPFTQIEARWTKLPEAEQGAIADRLAQLQKGDWKKMTLEEKRAGSSHLISLFHCLWSSWR